MTALYFNDEIQDQKNDAPGQSKINGKVMNPSKGIRRNPKVSNVKPVASVPAPPIIDPFIVDYPGCHLL